MPRATRRPSDEARRGTYKPRVDFSRSRRRREDGLLALRRLDRDAGLFKRRRDETTPAAHASDPAPAPPEADPPAAGALPPPTISSPPDAAAPRNATESEMSSGCGGVDDLGNGGLSASLPAAFGPNISRSQLHGKQRYKDCDGDCLRKKEHHGGIVVGFFMHFLVQIPKR